MGEILRGIPIRDYHDGHPGDAIESWNDRVFYGYTDLTLEDYLDYEGVNRWRESTDLVGKFIGIELELELTSEEWENGAIMSDVLAQLPDKDNDDEEWPDLELDGSLENDGVEIIFPPVPVENLLSGKSYAYKVFKALDGIKELAREGEPGDRGLHVNVNTNRWPEKSRALFCAVVNNLSDTTLKKFGGRFPSYHYCRRNTNVNVRNYYREEDAHVHLVEQKEGRLELRFPSSNLSPEGFIRLIHFVDYLTDFVLDPEHYEPAMEQKAKPQVARFRNWLREHKEERANAYAEKVSANGK